MSELAMNIWILGNFLFRRILSNLFFRFKGTGPVRERRCRIMSSYIQALTNQVWARCKKLGHNINVVFEPGVRKFEYMDDRVCVMPQASRDGAGLFFLHPCLINSIKRCWLHWRSEDLCSSL